jgi:hypothetical protein
MVADRAPSPLRRLKAAVRKVTEGKDPLAHTLRENGLRVRLEGNDILIEPFDLDSIPSVIRNQKGAETGLKIEQIANGEEY